MGMERINRYLLVLGLLLSSAVAGRIAFERWRVEARNRSVELILDYSEVAALAASERKPVSEWLSRFSTPLSVALTEGTLQEWGARYESGSGPLYVLTPDRYRQAKIALALKARVELKPPAQTPYVTVQSTEGGRFAVLGDPEWVAQLGLGLDPSQVRAVQAGRAQVVARLNNFPGIDAFAIRGTLQQLHQQGATLLVFAADQVLGFREHIKTTAQAIRAFGMRYGSIEFGKQAGDTQLSLLMPEHTVRLHSISATEAVTLAPGELVERLERAAQERNIRALYLRIGAGDTEQLRAVVQSLERALTRSGFTIRASGARPFQPLEPPPWLFPFIGLGVGILAGWLARQLGASRWLEWLPALLGVLLALLCLVPEGRKLVALAAAVLFPTVGLIMLPAIMGVRASEPGGYYVPKLLSLLIFPFGWSLMGALHIVGLLAGSAFLIKADQFVGIKVAHVLPLLLVGAFYAAYAVGSWDFWRRWLQQPIFWWQAGVAMMVLLALVLMLIRTGNEAPGAVSDLELRARALLENLMNVRPRTKEFLIGHPALVVALALLMANRRTWLPLAMLLGTIGQVSVVNTFCHLHSPLVVSLLRVVWGAGIGIVLGLLLVGLFRKSELGKW
ncbi:hypothetical protein HRbin15_02439 [bacterium HR15]|nr:hypothetical protein HRbin15_02439 [bacterium HR15]